MAAWRVLTAAAGGFSGAQKRAREGLLSQSPNERNQPPARCARPVYSESFLPSRAPS